MHEESLVRTLMQQVEELAATHEATQVERVEVEVGPLSGVEPLLLESAFERLKENSATCVHSILVIRTVELTAECLDCRKIVAIHDFKFVCSFCRSSALQILNGDSMLLKNVCLRSGVDS